MTPAGRRARPTVRRPGGALAPRNVFIWPSLLVILALSIFPLVISLYLSLSRLEFTPDGIDISFLGFNNYQTLLFGSEQSHLIGVMKTPSLLGWAIFLVGTGLLAWAFALAIRGGVGLLGLVFRALGGLFGIGLLWLLVETTFSPGGRPGTLFVTLSTSSSA